MRFGLLAVSKPLRRLHHPGPSSRLPPHLLQGLLRVLEGLKSAFLGLGGVRFSFGPPQPPPPPPPPYAWGRFSGTTLLAGKRPPSPPAASPRGRGARVRRTPDPGASPAERAQRQKPSTTYPPLSSLLYRLYSLAVPKREGLPCGSPPGNPREGPPQRLLRIPNGLLHQIKPLASG